MKKLMMMILLTALLSSILFGEKNIVRMANMANEKEELYLRELDFQVANEADNDENILSGLAIAYKKDSKPLYSYQKRTKYIERIMQGSITESLLDGDIRCLFAHDNKYVLGRTENNTLKLEENENGLYFRVEIPATTWARDLKTSVMRGDINQMSFGFMPLEMNWLENEATIREYGMPICEITKLKLTEISLVSNPAYKDTNVRELNVDDQNNEYKKNVINRKLLILKTGVNNERNV